MGRLDPLPYGETAAEAITAALEAKHQDRPFFYRSEEKGDPRFLLKLDLSLGEFLSLMDALWYTGSYRTGPHATWARHLRCRVLGYLGLAEEEGC